jgi:hypothetical protein
MTKLFQWSLFMIMGMAISCAKDAELKRVYIANKTIVILKGIEKFKMEKHRAPVDLKEAQPYVEAEIARFKQCCLNDSWMAHPLGTFESPLLNGKKPLYFEYFLYEDGTYILLLRIRCDNSQLPAQGRPSKQLIALIEKENALDFEGDSSFLGCTPVVAKDGEILLGSMFATRRFVSTDKPLLVGYLEPKPLHYKGGHSYTY